MVMNRLKQRKELKNKCQPLNKGKLDSICGKEANILENAP